MTNKTLTIKLNDEYNPDDFKCICNNKEDHFICYPCIFGVNLGLEF